MTAQAIRKIIEYYRQAISLALAAGADTADLGHHLAYWEGELRAPAAGSDGESKAKRRSDAGELLGDLRLEVEDALATLDMAFPGALPATPDKHKHTQAVRVSRALRLVRRRLAKLPEFQPTSQRLLLSQWYMLFKDFLAVHRVVELLEEKGRQS